MLCLSVLPLLSVAALPAQCTLGNLLSNPLGERKANSKLDLGTLTANARRKAKRHRDIGQANAWRKSTGSIPPKGIGSLCAGRGRLAICSTGAGLSLCKNRVANSVQIA